MSFKSIHGKLISFEDFLESLKNLTRKQATLLMGIDGCGGSGKSTFARELVKSDSSIEIVHMDDFYLPYHLRINSKAIFKPVGADFDWQRLREQVLKPLKKDRVGYYSRYDWGTDRLAEWHIVPVGGMVVVEGVYVLRKELAEFYDYKIWVDCPREIRLARGVERDGEPAREAWESNWMVAEDKYVREQLPFERADLIVDGSE